MNKLRPDWPTERLERLRALRRRGLSLSKCAKIMGYSKSTIAGQDYRHGMISSGFNTAPSIAAMRLAQFDPIIRRAIA